MRGWLPILVLLMACPAWGEGEPASEGSTPVEPASDRLTLPRSKVDSRQRGALWLSQLLPSGQVLWLNGEPGAPAAFLALYLPQTAGRNEGGAVILPDAGQHPAWPGVVSRLRQGLPETGWHTLALDRRESSAETLPARRLVTLDQPDFPFPGAVPRLRPDVSPSSGEASPGEGAAAASDPRTETNAATERLEVANNADPAQVDSGGAEPVDASLAAPSLAEPSPENLDRIGMGLRQLSEFGLLNQVLIGVGEGALDTLAYLRRQEPIPDRGLVLVWINARFDAGALEPAPEAGDALLRIPILDVHDGGDEGVQAAAEARARFARRHQLAAYRQVRLPRARDGAPWDQDPLVSRLSGWLREVAPGRDVPDPAQAVR